MTISKLVPLDDFFISSRKKIISLRRWPLCLFGDNLLDPLGVWSHMIKIETTESFPRLFLLQEIVFPQNQTYRGLFLTRQMSATILAYWYTAVYQTILIYHAINNGAINRIRAILHVLTLLQYSTEFSATDNTSCSYFLLNICDKCFLKALRLSKNFIVYIIFVFTFFVLIHNYRIVKFTLVFHGRFFSNPLQDS